MALFRDEEGNFYEVPDDDLRRFKVEGDLPKGAELTGAEVEPGTAPNLAGYFWGAPAVPLTTTAAAAPEAQQSRGYFWGVPAVPLSSAVAAAPETQAAMGYTWTGPPSAAGAFPVAYTYGAARAAHNYGAPIAPAAAYNYEFFGRPG